MNYAEQKRYIVTALEYMGRESHCDPDLYDICALAAWHALSQGQREQLRQLLFHGPTWDGDIINKGARDDLICFELATRVCYRGEQGHTAATYRALTIWKQSGETPIKLKWVA